MARTSDHDAASSATALAGGQYVVHVDRRTLTLADVAAGRVPEDLTGVRWADGTVECRANLLGSDYLARRSTPGQIWPGSGPGAVLTDPSVACDHCADKCG